MNKFTLTICALILVVIVCSSGIFAQSKINGITVSLSLSSSDIRKDQKVEGIVTIQNNSGKTISLRDLRYSIRFEEENKPYEYCRAGDCFIAWGSFNNRTIENGKSLVFRFNPKNYYWHDEALSGMDFSYPKNLYTVVPSGSYYLSMMLSTKADNWDKNDPRNVEVISNKILTTVNLKK